MRCDRRLDVAAEEIGHNKATEEGLVGDRKAIAPAPKPPAGSGAVAQRASIGASNGVGSFPAPPTSRKKSFC